MSFANPLLRLQSRGAQNPGNCLKFDCDDLRFHVVVLAGPQCVMKLSVSAAYTRF